MRQQIPFYRSVVLVCLSMLALSVAMARDSASISLRDVQNSEISKLGGLTALTPYQLHQALLGAVTAHNGSRGLKIRVAYPKVWIYLDNNFYANKACVLNPSRKSAYLACLMNAIGAWGSPTIRLFYVNFHLEGVQVREFETGAAYRSLCSSCYNPPQEFFLSWRPS